MRRRIIRFAMHHDQLPITIDMAANCDESLTLIFSHFTNHQMVNQKTFLRSICFSPLDDASKIWRLALYQGSFAALFDGGMLLWMQYGLNIIIYLRELIT